MVKRLDLSPKSFETKVQWRSFRKKEQTNKISFFPAFQIKGKPIFSANKHFIYVKVKKKNKKIDLFILQYIPFLFCSWQWNTQQDRSVYSTWINPNEQKYWKDEQNLLDWMVLQELVQGFGVLQHFWKIYFAPKH